MTLLHLKRYSRHLCNTWNLLNHCNCSWLWGCSRLRSLAPVRNHGCILCFYVCQSYKGDAGTLEKATNSECVELIKSAAAQLISDVRSCLISYSENLFPNSILSMLRYMDAPYSPTQVGTTWLVSPSFPFFDFCRPPLLSLFYLTD